MHKLLALALDATSALVLLSPTAYAAGPEAGHVHMLVLDAEQQPVVGATLRGAPPAGQFFGPTLWIYR